MNESSYTTLLHLLRASAAIHERLDGGLSAVHGLSLQEMLMLMFLDSEPRHRLSRVELARRMHVSASTVTRQLVPLEKRGIVTRQPDERDARLTYAVLTDAGEELVNDARQSLRNTSKQFFQDRWRDSEVATLATLLGRLTVNLPGSLVPDD
ncbi:MAG: hypothetical protein PsegKO_26890 [Pseudohongiellaceae bacterium]|jgi:DNA-binding MarR family transcriptional regulator